jgi:ParB family chromosome partitioning protein
MNIADNLKEIEIVKIRVNPFQPRKCFSGVELEELAESIKAVGIIHPPVVRPLDDDLYELVSGERRFRASELAGLTKIPVVVRSSSNALSAEAALIENIQRVDLNPIEISKALKFLSFEFGLNQDDLAKRVGKKRSTIANYLRLLSLPKGIQESLSQDLISMGHAKAILSLENFEKQNLLHELILRDELSVREAEAAAIRISEKAKKQKLVYVTRDFYLEQLAERIQKKFGTKVFIQGKGKKGRISIDYYNLDDLDRLLQLFGVQD